MTGGPARRKERIESTDRRLQVPVRHTNNRVETSHPDSRPAAGAQARLGCRRRRAPARRAAGPGGGRRPGRRRSSAESQPAEPRGGVLAADSVVPATLPRNFFLASGKKCACEFISYFPLPPRWPALRRRRPRSP